MNCDDLARTGNDLDWPAVLLVALALILIGATLLHGAGHRRRLLVMGVILCLLGAAVSAPVPRAQAACTSASANSLTITQTSSNTGLSPTQAPSPITGAVTNNGGDETFVTAIVVSIASVTKAAGAAAGTCSAGDYILLDPRIPVGEQLAANGGSADFAGASIGFLDSTANQDACKGAVVGLLYTTE
ncbi:hypothetical protein BH09ACT5_BH09ACT5_09590 [soil metagenome]